MSNAVLWSIIAALTAAFAWGVIWWSRQQSLHEERLARRLHGKDESPAPGSEDRPHREPEFPRRHRIVPWVFAAVLAATLLILEMEAIFALTIGLIVGILASQAETWWADRQRDRIETQLADALDIAISALYAGAGVLRALTAATQESRAPLRPYLEETLSRIRLGEDPAVSFQQLADRVPLETFRLAGITLAVHSRVGGSLAPTLSSVALTIRDRIEIARRARSLSAQAKISTAALVFVTALLFVILWREDPERMRSFLATGTGKGLLAGAMLLQAVGIVWQARMSRARF